MWTLHLFFLLLLSTPPLSSSLNLRQWHTLTSLSHSLLSRVANARANSGDSAGAARLQRLSGHLRLFSGGERWLGLGSGFGILSLSWDYFWNYYHSNGVELWPKREVLRLVRKVSEGLRCGSKEEISKWVLENHGEIRVLGLEVVKKLLKNFTKSGLLRETIMELKKEVEEGELLRECLQIGARDLEGLLQIAKDLFASSSSRDSEL